MDQIVTALAFDCSQGDISQAGTVSPEGLGKGHAYSITAVHKVSLGLLQVSRFTALIDDVARGTR